MSKHDYVQFKLEKDLTKHVKKYFEDLVKETDGKFAFRKISSRFTAGISDFLCCYNGQLFCIELKVQYNTPSPNQTKFLNDFSEAGAICTVCYDLITVKNIFNNFIKT